MTGVSLNSGSSDPKFDICQKSFNSLDASEVLVCKDYWKKIRAHCVFLYNVLRNDQITSNKDYENLRVGLGRVESTRKLLAKEELVNEEISTTEDLVQVGLMLTNQIRNLKFPFNMGSNKTTIFLTENDKKEWKAFQDERMAVTRNIDYCFAVARVPTLQEFIFKEKISNEETKKVVQLAMELKKTLFENRVLVQLCAVGNDPNAIRSKLEEIRKNTDQEVVKSNLNLNDSNIVLITTATHGDIFEAKYNGKRVVIKRVKEKVKEYRVQKEVVAMAALKCCSNVIKLRGYYLDGFYRCIVMDLYDYGCLYDFLDDQNYRATYGLDLNNDTKLNMAIGIANGLAAIHKLKIVHRDVKSPNILVKEDLTVVVADFDLVKLEGTGALTATLNDETKKRIGSVYWRAPETLSPKFLFSYKSDMWAFGVILWELYSEKKPYNLDEVFLVQEYIKSKDYPGSTDEIEDDIAKIIQHCWEFDPEKRTTAKDVLDMLKDLRYQKAGFENILELIREGQTDRLKGMAKNGLKLIELNNSNDILPLHEAISGKHFELLKWLINDVKLDVSKVDNMGNNILHKAAITGDYDMFWWLLNNNINDVNNVNDYQENPFSITKSARNEKGNNFLHTAAAKGDIEFVKRLILDAKFDIDATNNDMKTALELSRENGHNGVLEWLKKFSNATLHEAVLNNDTEVLKWLVMNKKENVSTLDQDGQTPLHLAADRGLVRVVEFLLTLGAEVDKTKSDGWTALHCAVRKGHFEVIKFLVLQANADLNKTTGYGETPLCLAIYFGKFEVSRWLIVEAKAGVKKAQNDGWTALHFAAWIGNVDIVMRLVVAGAEIEKPKKDGWTALHCAANRGHVGVVRWLVEEGKANINNTDNSGKKPYDLAKDNVKQWLKP